MTATVSAAPGGVTANIDAAIPAPIMDLVNPSIVEGADGTCANIRKGAAYVLNGYGRTSYHGTLRSNFLPTLYGGGTSQSNAFLGMISPNGLYKIEVGYWAQNNDTQGKYKLYWAYTQPGQPQSSKLYAGPIPPGYDYAFSIEKVSASKWRAITNGYELGRFYLPEGANNAVYVTLQIESWHNASASICNNMSFKWTNVTNPNLASRRAAYDAPYALQYLNSNAFIAKKNV